MKNLVTKALLMTAGVALAVQSASATNAYNAQGDLLLGLRESGFTDVVIDLGQASTYLNATATINLDTLFPVSGTYTSLASLINANFGGSASGITWSVGGSLKPATQATALYVTDPSDNLGPIVQGAMNNASTDINNYGLQYRNATSGNTLVANLAAKVAAGSSSYTVNGPAVTGQIGFNLEKLVPASGASIADFFSFTPGASGVSAPGYFEIDANGNGFFVVTPVPEPTTYGLIAAGGLLVLCIRRQFAGQRA